MQHRSTTPVLPKSLRERLKGRVCKESCHAYGEPLAERERAERVGNIRDTNREVRRTSQKEGTERRSRREMSHSSSGSLPEIVYGSLIPQKKTSWTYKGCEHETHQIRRLGIPPGAKSPIINTTDIRSLVFDRERKNLARWLNPPNKKVVRHNAMFGEK
jgi:hypothetical protein